jgi:hypothetical protein
MSEKQALDRAGIVIVLLSAVVPIGGAYLFYLGARSSDNTSEESVTLPTEDSEDADDSPDPAGDA